MDSITDIMSDYFTHVLICNINNKNVNNIKSNNSDKLSMVLDKNKHLFCEKNKYYILNRLNTYNESHGTKIKIEFD